MGAQAQITEERTVIACTDIHTCTDNSSPVTCADPCDIHSLNNHIYLLPNTPFTLMAHGFVVMGSLFLCVQYHNMNCL